MRATKPEYGFTFRRHPHRVTAEFNGVTVVDSDAVMVLDETRLAPMLYFPREHVRMDLMHRSAHVTYCPLRGNASYWTLQVEDRTADNVMWSYEEPPDTARAVEGYAAFYANLFDEWSEAGSRLVAARREPDDRNPLLDWLLRDAPEMQDARSLTRSFAGCLVEDSVPLWRLSILIRTLHPQLMGVTYLWWRSSDEVERIFVPNRVLQSPAFLNSPIVPIFDGAGGIRRRLDVQDPILDYEILRELHSEGATDYVAMPMYFSNGQINVVTLASDARGGFGTSDLGHVYEILSNLGRLYEVHAMRYTAVTLLDTYLGRHAGQRVLNGLIKRGDGETIRAIIWFCDLRESTPLAQSMSREEFLNTLNEFFDGMAGAVLAGGGQVLRFIGDAALAIFPVSEAPDAGDDEAQARARALAAARDARARLSAINASRRQAGDRALSYGVALHVGEVTYGNIGTEERLEFTVIGDAANRAARIEALCKTLGRPVLASGEFARHFPEDFESLGHHEVRGVNERLEIYALREQD